MFAKHTPSATPRAAEAASFDRQILEEIEAARKDHGELRDQRVRAEGEIARIDAELAELCPRLQEQYGADDIDGLRGWVATKKTEATEAKDAYVNAVNHSKLRAAHSSGIQA